MPKGFSLASTICSESYFRDEAVSRQLLAENESGGRIEEIEETGNARETANIESI